MFHLEPYKLTDLTCEELGQRTAAAAKRAETSEDLRQKASRDAVGPLVSAVVYAPDHDKARWEYSTYRAQAERKNCETGPAKN